MKVLREGLLKLSISREIMPLLDLKGRALWGLQPWPLGTLAKHLCREWPRPTVSKRTVGMIQGLSALKLENKVGHSIGKEL